jgi:hypothetical protein
MKPAKDGPPTLHSIRKHEHAAGPATEHLLSLLRDAEHIRAMDLADWDTTVRLARQARILGTLAHRLRHHDGLWTALPGRVRGQMQASINYAAYRQQLVRMELRSLDQVLPTDMPVAMLKGAAYLLQDLPPAQGRMPNDVDLLVPRARLDAAEAALKAAGWRVEVKDAYDERYYREWSHELPPMRYPGHTLEVDLHHTIAPVTSRARADDALLHDGLRPVPGSRYLVLHPQDQVLHAVIQLFQDSELAGELRGLVDIDGLLRVHISSEADWSGLIERAARHNASRILWYALHYCRTWLGTPVPYDMPLAPPPRWARHAMDWVFSRSMLPRIPDQGPTPIQRLADLAAQLRYHRLRMPPHLLAQHLLHKAWEAIRPAGSARHTKRGNTT